MHIREVFQRPQALENLPQKHDGAVSIEQSVICIERVFANIVLENDIDKIINVFASRKGRASAFFYDLALVYESFWFEFATQLL